MSKKNMTNMKNIYLLRIHVEYVYIKKNFKFKSVQGLMFCS